MDLKSKAGKLPKERIESSACNEEEPENGFCEFISRNTSATTHDAAIRRIDTAEGIKEMQQLLEAANADQNAKHLCTLLSYCWQVSIYHF